MAALGKTWLISPRGPFASGVLSGCVWGHLYLQNKGTLIARQRGGHWRGKLRVARVGAQREFQGEVWWASVLNRAGGVEEPPCAVQRVDWGQG